MSFSELINIYDELKHASSNISRLLLISKFGSDILPPQKCLLAASLKERLLKYFSATVSAIYEIHVQRVM